MKCFKKIKKPYKIDSLFCFFLIKNKTKMEKKENCIICFEDIDSSDMIRKWECCHTFHKSCIHNWDNKCPMCRNANLIIPEITFQITRNPRCPFWLQNMSNCAPNLQGMELENVKTDWKDRDCITNNHKIIFIKIDTGFKIDTYGICENCNTYQNMSRIFRYNVVS